MSSETTHGTHGSTQSARTHRIVHCRADEAAAITRASQGEFHPDLREHCCPHLDLFHNSGRREDGSYWRACTFIGCECDWEDPDADTRRALYAAERSLERAERASAAQGWWLFGAVCGLVPGALAMML